jgi:hypothetical protein
MVTQTSENAVVVKCDNGDADFAVKTTRKSLDELRDNQQKFDGYSVAVV